MSAEHLQYTQDTLLRHRVADVIDPGSGGTIVIENKALAICRVKTAGPESRLLEDANHFGVGTQLLVILETDGGDLTVNGVTLDDAGEAVMFTVSVADGVHVWVPGTVGAPAAPVSAGTYEFLETPTEQDIVDGLLTILAALQSGGLIDASGITQDPGT